MQLFLVILLCYNQFASIYSSDLAQFAVYTMHLIIEIPVFICCFVVFDNCTNRVHMLRFNMIY